jgi:hypothetical protein
MPILDGHWLDVNGTPASKNANLTQRIRKVKLETGTRTIVQVDSNPPHRD